MGCVNEIQFLSNTFEAHVLWEHEERSHQSLEVCIHMYLYVYGHTHTHSYFSIELYKEFIGIEDSHWTCH
jgi:hypothetical protein